MIQTECDRQSSNVIEEFRRKRHISDKVNKIRESMYVKSTSFPSEGSAIGGGTCPNPENKIEAKELDHILSEITLLQARSEMYFNFVRKRVMVRIWLRNST